jgi:hypothetical protein
MQEQFIKEMRKEMRDTHHIIVPPTENRPGEAGEPGTSFHYFLRK